MKCQQHELYEAQRVVDHGRTFGSVREMQTWVDLLRDTRWWARDYLIVRRVEVYGRSENNREGSCGGWFPEKKCGVMEMHPTHWNELIVLHELAHVLAEARYDSKSHDPWFARVYMELVYNVMGPDAYNALHWSFDINKIEHDLPEED